MAEDFLDFDRQVEDAKDDEVACIEAQEHGVEWGRERAAAYRIATSQPPPGTFKGYAMRFGEDWGVTGRACTQSCIPQIHSDSLWYNPQRTTLPVMVLGGLRPPCQRACGRAECNCRTYTVDSTAMRAVVFLQFSYFRNVLVQGKVLTNLVKQDDRVAHRLVRQRREQKVSGSSLARGLFNNFENNKFITTIVRNSAGIKVLDPRAYDTAGTQLLVA
jgi:hypothetical protein